MVKRSRILWQEGLSSFGDLFGLEYIYGTLTNSDGKDPIDYSAIQKNPAQFELVATKAVSGQPVYLDKSIMKQDDYRAIMASSAIPAACHPIKINGQAYYDGGVSDALPCKRALEQGCDKLVVITSKPRDFQKNLKHIKTLYFDVSQISENCGSPRLST